MVRLIFRCAFSCAESVHPWPRRARHRTPTTPASRHLLSDTATGVDHECLAKACGDLSEALKTRFPAASSDTIARIIKTASTAIASDPPGPLYFNNNVLACIEPKKAVHRTRNRSSPKKFWKKRGCKITNTTNATLITSGESLDGPSPCSIASDTPECWEGNVR